MWDGLHPRTGRYCRLGERDFVTVADAPRTKLARHPWSVGGGGVGDVKALIESSSKQILAEKCSAIGGAVRTGADEAFSFDPVRFRHSHIPATMFRDFLSGEEVRDWIAATNERAYYPYSDGSRASAVKELWPWRTGLALRVTFQGVMEDAGLLWTDYMQHTASTYCTPLSITFGEVATHNHFVLDRGGKVFKQTAPAIKLPSGASEDDHLGLLGVLNSSTACFWLKQVCYPKGGDHVGQEGARVTKTKWDDRYSFNGANVQRLPIADPPPLDLARVLDTEAQHLSTNLPVAVAVHATPTRAALNAARTKAEAARARMIALQEELDWRCYRLYGLLEEAVEHINPPPLRLGERAFEIVLARRMAAGELETAWFERHRSTPITELPMHWPVDYRNVVERRVSLIETDPNIGLVERPEYKRRWSMAPWEDMEKIALRDWLLDRLENPRLWPMPAELLTTNQLADRVHRDADFVSVALLYRGREDVDREALVAELVGQACVPFLAALRYTETGLRKRVQWENTWRQQRQEDEIDAEVAAARPTLLPRAESKVRERWRAIHPCRDDETPDTYADADGDGHRSAPQIEEVGRPPGRCGQQRRRKNGGGWRHPGPPKIHLRGIFKTRTIGASAAGLTCRRSVSSHFRIAAPRPTEASSSPGQATITWRVPWPSAPSIKRVRTRTDGLRNGWCRYWLGCKNSCLGWCNGTMGLRGAVWATILANSSATRLARPA